MPVSDQVGIRYREVMTGFAGEGEDEPEAGEARGRTDGTRLTFDLDVVIPGLNHFVGVAPHLAHVRGGTVDWRDHLRSRRLDPQSTLEFFQPGDRQGHARFVLDVAFEDQDGRDCRLTGRKELLDESLQPAGGPRTDAMVDTTTMFVELAREGQAIGAGIVRIGIPEFFTQLESLHVVGTTSDAEKHDGRRMFMTFFNDQLRGIYAGIPAIFRGEDRLTALEWWMLQRILRELLPDPLPANGPTIEECVAKLEEYVTRSTARELGIFRDVLDLTGPFVRPILEGIIGGLRESLQEVQDTGEPNPIAELMHSLAVLPYYAHEKVDAQLNYPRPDVAANRAGRQQQPLATVLPHQAEELEREHYDVAIVGSGPAGGLLAQRLTAQGKRVIVLEKGPYVPEHEIGADEVAGIARLYKSSGFQRANVGSRDLREFLVLQGSCVGGGAVVNNGVCFRMPAARIEEWRDVGFPFTVAQMKTAYDAVAQDLHIGPLGDSANRLNPAGKYLEAGLGLPIQKPSVDDEPQQGLWECLVNFEARDDADPDGTGCASTGLCNTGCGSLRRSHVLREHLPAAMDTGLCTIVPLADARELVLGSTRFGTTPTVEKLKVRVGGEHDVEIRADEYVLAAGAIGSTFLLQASRDLDRHFFDKGIPCGKRFCANVGAPVLAIANLPLHAQTTVQISHYVWPDAADAGWVVESWYNPPGSQALTMPGYLDVHWDRMHKWDRTMAAAPLVGSEPSGELKFHHDLLGIRGARKIHLPVGATELARLKPGVAMLGEAFLTGGQGEIESIVLPIDNGVEVTSVADMHQALDAVNESRRLRHGTGHPQGGNPISTDDDIATLGPDFRVRGITNLRVADTSVFPLSTGVNPQWTAMAIAHLCAVTMS